MILHSLLMMETQLSNTAGETAAGAPTTAMVSDKSDVHRYPISHDVTPSRATYLAVADVKECDPLDIPPIGQTINTDSIDSLISTATNGQSVRIAFEYAGCSVTITPGEIEVANP